jgi:integrase
MTHLSLEEMIRAEKVAEMIDSTGITKYILLFLYGTGMRVSEFTSLTMSDFDSKRKNLIQVKRECTKSRNGVRDIYIDNHLLKLIKKYRIKDTDPKY